MEANSALREQSARDAELTIKSMGIQLGMNLSVSVLVLLCVSWMHPQHRLVYSPPTKAATSATASTPAATTLGMSRNEKLYGRLAWIKYVMTAPDDVLIEKIGLDAVLFLRFIRILRQLIFVLTFLGLGILMPINILGTIHTGEWPPMPYDYTFLSVSGINYLGGQLSPVPDSDWYWAPAIATWVFTAIVVWYLHHGSRDYIAMRRQFWESPAYHLSSRSLFITNLPPTVVSDSDLRSWLETTGAIKYPMQQVVVGKENAKLVRLFERYKKAVFQLEDTLASYLKDGKKKPGKRPTIRIHSTFGCGGKKVDAIRYYSKLVSDLYTKIEKTPPNSDAAVNYGWISFAHVEWAHETGLALQRFMKVRTPDTHIRVSPPANDIIWANLVLDPKIRRLKRWLGLGLFITFVCAWQLPVTALAAASNVVNLIRMIPQSRYYIQKYWFVIGLLQAYVTPVAMALFFFFLPRLFKVIGKRQGFRTRSTLDRRILLMLYIFFVTNHLIVFTLSSTLIGIYGQLRQLVLDGLLGDEIVHDYVVHVVKNITDSSSFWINLTCVKAFGVSMELAQIIPVLTITLRRWIFRPSPRKLKAWKSFQYFNYPQNYNILLFFFTIALVYSATSPLVLPFACIYFVAVTGLYRYMLMSIYVTKTETGGKLWPVLFQITLVSTLLFQVITFVILILKGGGTEAYIILPLPIFTLAYQILYGRRMAWMGSFLTLNDTRGSNETRLDPIVTTQSTVQNDLARQYRDPALDYAQLVPIVLDDVKDLLAQVYPKYKRRLPKTSTDRDLTNASGPSDVKHQVGTAEEMAPGYEPLPVNPHYHHNRFILYDPDSGQAVHFCSVSEDYFGDEVEFNGDGYVGEPPINIKQRTPVNILEPAPFHSGIEPSAPPGVQETVRSSGTFSSEKVAVKSTNPPIPFVLPMRINPPPNVYLPPVASASEEPTAPDTPTSDESPVINAVTTQMGAMLSVPLSNPDRPNSPAIQRRHSLPILPFSKTHPDI